MRKILLLVVGISVGLGFLLAGCRKSDDTAQADTSAAADSRLAIAEMDEDVHQPEAVADEYDFADGEAEAEEVEIADETVAVEFRTRLGDAEAVDVSAEDVLTEAEGAPQAPATSETPAAPELALAEAEETPIPLPPPVVLKETQAPAAPKPQAGPAAQPETSDWLAARSKEILEKEKALIAKESVKEKDIWSREARPPAPVPAPAAPADVSAMAPPRADDVPPPELPVFAGPEMDENAPAPTIAEQPKADAPASEALPVEVPPLTLAETEGLPVLPEGPPPAAQPPAPVPTENHDVALAPLPEKGEALELPPLPEMQADVPGVVEPDDLQPGAIAQDGAPAPQPEAPPVDPRTAKAREIISQEAKETALKEEALRAEAEAKYRAGLNLFKNQLYEDALRAFEEAVAKCPDHKDAIVYRDKCRDLLGRPGRDDSDILIKRLTEREKTAMDAVAMKTKADLEMAAKLLLRATNPSDIDKLKPRDQQIQEALGDLETAIEKLRQVDSILTSSPMSMVQQKEMRLQVQALKTQVGEAKESLLAEREERDRDDARAAAERRRLSADSIRRERLQRLLNSAEFHFRRKEFDKAREMADMILQMDPRNADALDMRTRARQEAHRQAGDRNTASMHDAEVNWTLDVRNAAIMPSDDLVYPEDWEQIKRRVSRQREIEGGSIMEKQIRDRLEGVRVTIDYNETPISDVLRELSEKGGVNIVRNTDVEPDTAVTLTVTNMSLAKVLDWIMDLTDLHYEIKNEAIYVSREVRRRLILQLYPVFDLTRPMTNYYPTTGDDDDDDDDDDDEGITDIRERITRFVAPDSWGEGEGVTLEIWEDNLLVMQTPEVHAKLVAYLNRLREAAKQQVLVEGRFINITGNFLEEIGLTWDATHDRQGFPSQPLIRDGRGMYWRTIDDGREMRSAFSLQPGGASPGGETAREGLRTVLGYLSMQSAQSDAGVLRHFEVNAVLHALQEKQQGSVLHNPRLLVANGRNAYLEIFTTTNYVSNWTQQGTVFQPEVEQYEQGVEWSVRPVISFDRKYITIRVRPRIIAFDPANSRSEVQHRIIATASIGTDAIPEEVDLEFLLPVLETTQLESFVTIPDGGTVLMGGLIHDDRQNNISGIPLLSSIPFVGRAFRTEKHSQEQRNLVIMVQGKIIELDA